MVSIQLARFAVVAAALSAAAVAAQSEETATCDTAPYGACGSNATGVKCCPQKYYCLPWDAAFYQCVPQPAACALQLPNVDLYGNDLKTLYGLKPDECCAACTTTAGCVAYTFVNSNPGQPACYLKNAVGAQTASPGAVSGVVNSATTPTPTPTATTTAPPPPPTTTAPPTPSTTAPPTPSTTAPPTPSTTAPPTPSTTAPPPSGCTTAAYGACGDSNGTTCCPSGFYCQPWNPTFYQCVPTPAKCSAQLTDTDFYGNDLKTVYVGLPTECCDACAATPGCKAYTYVNYHPGQPACYLKSAAGAPSRLVGGVSGTLN